MQHKRCSKCGQSLPIDAFAKSYRPYGGGLRSQCRECRRPYLQAHGREWKRKKLSEPGAREVHRQRCRASMTKLRMSNPAYAEQWARKGSKRWVRAISSSDGSVTNDLISALLSETHCAYCGRHTDQEARQIEHVWPLSKGGQHSADNLVMSCASCNRQKRAQLPLQWLVRISSGPSCNMPSRVMSTPMFF
jgi:5-methylcytosine-specific restriction endonuclease McrA